MGEYIDKLLLEAETYRTKNVGVIDTVYIGGGTPSLLSEELLARLVLGLEKIFDICDAEFTIEANPGTLTRAWAETALRLGANRISLGLQSIHENELKLLGRIHSFEDFLVSFNMLREVGFDNISVDLMFGIPEQTIDSFISTLTQVIALSPEHISAYGLIIEEGTPFFDIQDSLPLPNEDEERLMYFSCAELLRKNGYYHYEISNFAKEGKESRHNLKYWRAKEYIGLGAAAYSFFDGARYGNVHSLVDYLSLTDPKCDVDHLSREDMLFEYAMMHFRLAEGIDLEEYYSCFGSSFLSEGCDKEKKIKEYISLGLMKNVDGHLSLTEQGFYVSNSILADIL